MDLSAHPELASEQAYVDEAYGCLEAMYERVSAFAEQGRNDFERDVFEAWREARLASLSDRSSPLVFGRLDPLGIERYYVGRRHVEGPAGEVVVVDWRARIARVFYHASLADPMGLERRRHFLGEGREVLGIADDVFARGIVTGEQALAAQLERRRTGEMADIAATIQAEQDAIIRAPLEGVVVVQGGPGTGKTAIGLHRAAFLLYEYRQVLTRSRVLVVGPNPTFMRYIARVLPSLGEYAVTQRSIRDLGPPVEAAPEPDPRVERLKGEARMAAVMARALHLGRGEPDGDLRVWHGRYYSTVPAGDLARLVASLRERGVPWADGRRQLREQILDGLQRSADLSPERRSEAARDPEFKRTLDTLWPPASAIGLVRGLLTSPLRLGAASGGALTEEEQRLLLAAARRHRPFRWTAPDVALLDEAGALVDGPPDRYGHLVADEAQDLSPMQVRMLARRCPSGSVTVLGDLAQATGAWAHERWEEVVEHLPTPHGSRVEELTLGYRVAGPIMEMASAVLRAVAPGLAAPRALRSRGSAAVVRASVAERDDIVVEAASRMAALDGSVAVIAPASLVPAISAALERRRVVFGDAERDGLGRNLSLVAAPQAKGLEFDRVVLVEPAALVAEAAESGLRLLYVAMTRALRDLVLVHSEPLPEPLAAGPSPSPL